MPHREAEYITVTPELCQVGIDPMAVARVVLFAIDQPDDVNVSEFTILPARQP
jgi:NADP-dependent 3-hydroxy acid dehydrogenase YdfG